VFDILQKQLLFKDDREKDAIIAIDQMSLVCSEQFDPSTQTHIGYASILDIIPVNYILIKGHFDQIQINLIEKKNSKTKKQ